MKQTIYKYVPSSVRDAGATQNVVRVIRRMAVRAARVKCGAAGRAFARAWHDEAEPRRSQPPLGKGATNPLEAFFEARIQGRGIFKWRHYFEIYDRHLAKFAGQPTTVLEIGIFGGGSLDMWRHYFGPDSRLYAVDIDPDCAKFEDVTVVIGDQADRSFWEVFRAEVPSLDVVIDDGGHTPEQQLVTLEEVLPHLRPGGVYICEDIHGHDNAFLSYVYGLTSGLFAYARKLDDGDPDRQLSSPATPFQSAMHSVHLYPYVVVIERRRAPVHELTASKRGTEWPRSHPWSQL